MRNERARPFSSSMSLNPLPRAGGWSMTLTRVMHAIKTFMNTKRKPIPAMIGALRVTGTCLACKDRPRGEGWRRSCVTARSAKRCTTGRISLPPRTGILTVTEQISPWTVQLFKVLEELCLLRRIAGSKPLRNIVQLIAHRRKVHRCGLISVRVSSTPEAYKAQNRNECQLQISVHWSIIRFVKLHPTTLRRQASRIPGFFVLTQEMYRIAASARDQAVYHNKLNQDGNRKHADRTDKKIVHRSSPRLRM